MGGRRWTPEEFEFIDEKRSCMTAENMARLLGRTRYAVVSQLQKNGWESYKTCSEYISLHRIYLTLGMCTEKLKRWNKTGGLHIRRIGACQMIHQEDLIRYLRDHQDEWNAAKVADGTILSGLDWYEEKRARDRGKHYYWTDAEVKTLKRMYAKGDPLKEISAATGKTYLAVKQKLSMMRKSGWRI